MDRIKRLLRGYFYRVKQSIAFLPVPMIALAIALGLGLYYLEGYTGISKWLAEKVPSLAVTSQDTARTTLGLFIGGLISLTVFAFSQIMVLLNQVASSYSPRLLRKMTGDRSLQFVMGYYIATIVLSLSVLVSIRSEDDAIIPNFSILLCVLLGTSCLVMFIYFVSTISDRIQVDSIIRRVTTDCSRAIAAEGEEENYVVASHPNDKHHWPIIPNPHGGYIGSVDFSSLASLSDEYNTRFYLGPRRGEYVPQRLPLLHTERELSQEERARVLSAVSPVLESLDDWYLPHFRQLTEIALKAMSPGINDPGTALDVLDHQTELLVQLLALPPYNCYAGDGGGRVYYNTYSFPEILRLSMQELRQYSKSDPLVMSRLIQLLYHLRLEARHAPAFLRVIDAEIRAVVYDANRHLGNPLDRTELARTILTIRRQVRRHEELLPPS